MPPHAEARRNVPLAIGVPPAGAMPPHTEARRSVPLAISVPPAGASMTVAEAGRAVPTIAVLAGVMPIRFTAMPIAVTARVPVHVAVMPQACIAAVEAVLPAPMRPARPCRDEAPRVRCAEACMRAASARKRIGRNQ